MAASATPFHIEEDQAMRSVGEHVVELGLRVPLLKVKDTKTGIFARIAGPSKLSEKSPLGAKELANSSMIKVCKTVSPDLLLWGLLCRNQPCDRGYHPVYQ